MFTKRNFPNLLTIFRGILTLIIIALFFIPLSGRFWMIYVFFIMAAASDYLDGYLARKWGVVSDFGKMFDPLFDKILTISLYFLLVSFTNWLLAIIFVLLLLRELIVDSAKNFLLAKGIMTSAIMSAKIKTAAQVAMLNFILLNLIFIDSILLNRLGIIFGLLAIFFAYWSALIYLKKFISNFKNIGHERQA